MRRRGGSIARPVPWSIERIALAVAALVWAAALGVLAARILTSRTRRHVARQSFAPTTVLPRRVSWRR